jgi:glycosyltransferase involved in cell wall biosynthesis
VHLGVDATRIDIVEHGVDLATAPAGQDRQGIIFFGGHKLNSGKGLETLCQALAAVRSRLGAATPVLKIFGYYGEETVPYGKRCAEDAGVADLVVWLNRLEPDEITQEFQKSLLCVLPFVGSFAGMPAGVAMAQGVPVIATRRAGLPEHLGDAGVFFEVKDVEALTSAILNLLGDAAQRDALAAKGRARAAAALTWDVVAEKTLRSYEQGLRHKRASVAA